MIAVTCFPTLSPTQKRTLSALQKKAPTPWFISRSQTNKRKSHKINHLWIHHHCPTKLPPLTYPQPQQNPEKNRQYHLTKPSLINYKSRMAIPYYLAE